MSVNDWVTLLALLASFSALILTEKHNKKTRAIASDAHEIAKANSAHRYSVRISKEYGSADGLGSWIKINLEILNIGTVPINVKDIGLFYSDKREGAMRNLFEYETGVDTPLPHGGCAVAKTIDITEAMASEDPDKSRCYLRVVMAHGRIIELDGGNATLANIDSSGWPMVYCDHATGN